MGLFALDGCTGALDLSGRNSSGMKYEAEYTDGPSGIFAGALYLTSSDSSYISINSSSAMDTKYSLTVLLHFKAEKSGSLLYQENGIHLFVNDSSLILNVLGSNGEKVIITQDIKYQEWYYIAAVYDYDMDMALLYSSQNGAMLTTQSASTEFSELLSTSGNYHLGGSVESNEFEGSVSCLQVYDRALSIDEVPDHRECPAGLNNHLHGKATGFYKSSIKQCSFNVKIQIVKYHLLFV